MLKHTLTIVGCGIFGLAHASQTVEFVNTPSDTYEVLPPSMLDNQTKTQEPTAYDGEYENLGQLQKAVFSAIAMHSIPAIRELLPLYEQSSVLDVNVLKAGRAMLAYDRGDYQLALSLYQKVIKEHDLPFFRMLLAKTYFYMHADVSAKQQFNTLLDLPDLPDAMHQEIKQYLLAIDARYTHATTAGASYVHDKNVNNVSNITHYKDWVRQDSPESATGLSYQASAKKDWLLGDHWSLQTTAQALGKHYWDNPKYNDLTTRIAFGTAYQTASNQITINPFIEHRRYSNALFSQQTGIRLDYQSHLSPKCRLYVAGEVGKTLHSARKHLDGLSYSVETNLMYLQRPEQYWTVGLDHQSSRLKDKDESYHRNGIKVSLTRQWQNGLTSSLSAGVAQRRYHAPDYFDILRKDTEYSLSGALSHSHVAFWGVQPQLVGTWYKNSSNHPFYEHQKNAVFIRMNKAF